MIYFYYLYQIYSVYINIYDAFFKYTFSQNDWRNVISDYVYTYHVSVCILQGDQEEMNIENDEQFSDS